MAILKMVAEGKITAEEGESLLQTLDTPDESQQDPTEQLPSEDEEESSVEILKSGAESLKDQGGLSRDFSRVLRKSARDVKRGRRRYRGGGTVCATKSREPRCSLKRVRSLIWESIADTAILK